MSSEALVKANRTRTGRPLGGRMRACGMARRCVANGRHHRLSGHPSGWPDPPQRGRAFGPLIEFGDLAIVPVAFVAGGGDDRADGGEAGGPRGGGRRGIVRPLGVYVLTRERVRWLPAVNATVVAVAALAAAGLAVRAIGRRRARVRKPAGGSADGPPPLRSTS